jgi:hypothetical protein
MIFWLRSILAVGAFCGSLHAQQATFVVSTQFGSFGSASSVSSTATGDLVITDLKENALFQFSTKGLLVRKIGGQGWGQDEFDQPVDVCATFPLSIYVVDYQNRRIQHYDRHLNLVQSISEDFLSRSIVGRFFPRACALSSHGDLFIVEDDGNRIIKLTASMEVERIFDRDSRASGRLQHPRDIVCSTEDRLYVLDEDHVDQYDLFGNFLSSITLQAEHMPATITLVQSYLVVTTAREIIFIERENPDRRIVLPQSAIIGLKADDELIAITDTSDGICVLTEHAALIGILHLQ